MKIRLSAVTGLAHRRGGVQLVTGFALLFTAVVIGVVSAVALFGTGGVIAIGMIATGLTSMIAGAYKMARAATGSASFERQDARRSTFLRCCSLVLGTGGRANPAALVAVGGLWRDLCGEVIPTGALLSLLPVAVLREQNPSEYIETQARQLSLEDRRAIARCCTILASTHLESTPERRAALGHVLRGLGGRPEGNHRA